MRVEDEVVNRIELAGLGRWRSERQGKRTVDLNSSWQSGTP